MKGRRIRERIVGPSDSSPPRRKRDDVVLVSMPFGSVFWPSYALSLLAAELARESIGARVEYFTIPFAERIGQKLYSDIAGGEKPLTYELAGEWIFAEALFGEREGESYLERILEARSLVSGRELVAPLSPAFIDGVRRAREGVDRFLDDSLEHLLGLEPKLVGFTSVFQQHVASLALAKRLAARAPDVFIVLGGANCEGVMGAETIRQFPFVDAVVSGEGERVFPALVTRLLNRRGVDELDGVFTRANVDAAFRRACFPSAPPVEDLDSLPYPDYGDYFEQFGASRFEREWQPSIFFETSRGCWWGARQHCTFCGLNGSTMAYRSKSPERALEEIVALAETYPESGIDLVDNILDVRYFKDFLPALADRRLGLDLFYETKANLTKTQVRILAQAGVRAIQPGIESLSDPILKQMRKGVSALQNVQLLKWCKELSVRPSWNLLWGFPGEPEEEYERMARLVPELEHLPPPSGIAGLRLDRFSPHFADAEAFGLDPAVPVESYRHVYPFPDEVLGNLAYFFSSGERERCVPAYVKPLLGRLRKWRSRASGSDLFAVDVGRHLLIWDLRSGAREPLTVLEGLERALYRACDEARRRSSLARALDTARSRPLVPAEIEDRLGPLVERGLLVAQGERYLALAIPLGEYVPSDAVGRRFLETARGMGRPFRGGTVVPLPSGSRGASQSRLELRPRKRSAHAITPECFRIVAMGQPVVV